MSRKLFNVVTVLVMLSMLIIPASAQGPAAQPGDPDSKLQLEAVNPEDIKQVGNPNATVKGEIKGATGVANYIIRLADAPLASYRGGVDGLEATNPASRGAVKLDMSSQASQDYLAYLAAEQASMISLIEAEVGRSVDVLYQFQVAYNGLALTLTPDEAAQVAKLPGVVNVTREFLRYPTTDAGPAFIGAPGIWDGSAAPPGYMGTFGEDVVVGIIDTGLNLDNPSFADVGDDGYDHTNPLGAGNYLGLCDTDPGTWVCNDKLIGYYIFTGETTEDTDGHGSHTGSTTAGNVVYDAEVAAPTASYTADISGVAPHGNIIGYDGCLDGGGCPFVALVAAIEQATADGVDVINYSIGGGTSDPWADDDALAFLGAVDAGVIPVTSAGNAGPGAATLGSPAEAPWMLAVGASSHDRYIRNDLVSMTGGDTTPPADMIGKGLSSGYGPADIVYAGDYGNALCAPGVWAAGTFIGEIVVCDRGTYGRVEKSEVVLAAGGGGYVLANTANESATLNGDPFALPGVHISYADGVLLKAWLASGTGHTATISGFSSSFDPSFGDAMTYFSSRGPSPSVPWIIKPDVTAPGLDVMAAYRDPEVFNIISGTSMASPHTAGAAALMRALHPDWTVAEIKSAMMGTALTSVVKEDGSTPADPFDMGAGRVNLSGAGLAGLVLDITTTEYQDASPADGGDPKTLNLASMADNQCLEDCTWTRTVRSTLDFAATYTATFTSSTPGFTGSVTPDVFTIPAGGTQELVITANSAGLPAGDWVFGEVMLETDAEFVAPPVGMNGSYSFTSSPAAAIPDSIYDGTPATMACDVIDASSIPAGEQVTDVTLITNLAHTWVGDLVAKLFSPDGSVLGVFSRPGYVEPADDGTGGFGDSSNMVTDYTLSFAGYFTDDPETMGNTIADAGVICQDDGRCTYYANPGAVAGLPDFAGFDGENASGDWTLCVGDSAAGDTGTLGSWGLNIETAPTAALLVPDLHMPVAVVPTAGILPASVDITTRRNAGSELVTDLQSIEITELTFEYFGLVQATLTSEELIQDPSNGDPFNGDGGTFVVTATVPADAKRLVAQVTYSEAPDVDLFVGTGDTPSAATQVCSSTSPTANELCDITDPAAGTYWMLVQNWTGSVDVPDMITLASAVVPGEDSGNLMVTGPTSVPAGTPFDIRVYWDTPEMMAGDRWYGAFSLGSDAGNPGNIATIPVNIVREDDDVTKEASAEVVASGDTVTYTITVQPNVFSTDLNYTITDTIPAGLTYVPGSASASDGTVNVVGDTVSWTGMMATPRYSYNIETSFTDPAMCVMPLNNSGAYTDLQAYGIATQSAIFGDTVWYTVNFSGGAHNFFNEYFGEVFNFTDDGFAFFDPATPGTDPYVNFPIPTPGDPDNLMAIFWRDMEIVYEGGAANRGVSLANLTSGGVPVGYVIEYDNVEDWPAGENPAYDIEMFGYYDDQPGDYEYIMAYDNLEGDVTVGTIGLENKDGTIGAQYGFDDLDIVDGMAICFDQVQLGADPVTITYQVTVDEGLDPLTELTNNAVHNTDNMGSMEAVASDTVRVEGVRLEVAHLAPFAADPGTAVTVTLNGAAALTNFEFADSTGYIPLPPGDYDVEIFPVGATDPAITGTVSLMDGMDYSAIAAGDGANQALGLLALADDNTPPAAGTFHLRIGHLAPFASGDALADVRLQDGTVLIDDVAFGDVTSFTPFPAGEYDLKITSPDGSMTYIDPLPVTFNDGDIVSAYAVGDGVNQPLGVFAWPAGVPGFLLPLAGYGVEVSPPVAAQSGAPGETVMYTLQVTNTGDLTNTFGITYTGNTWAVDLSETSLELGAGESVELMVDVMIPAGAADGDMDMVTVEVSGDGGAMAASELTTTAVVEAPGESKVFLPVIPQAYTP